MSARHAYKTVKSPSEATYKVQGSKHLAFVYPISDEAEAKQILLALRKAHESAHHVCFAYRIGADHELFRFSDDGEPSGTAGKPIFGQIQSFDLTNVLVAVVRYFGGTKLGTGGLIDAYRTASRMAIEQAEIVEKEVEDILEITFDYDLMPQVMHWLKTNRLKRISLLEGTKCVMRCQSATSRRAEYEKELGKIGAEFTVAGRVG